LTLRAGKGSPISKGPVPELAMLAPPFDSENPFIIAECFEKRYIGHSSLKTIKRYGELESRKLTKVIIGIGLKNHWCLQSIAAMF
jgi:hypothetical protein